MLVDTFESMKMRRNLALPMILLLWFAFAQAASAQDLYCGLKAPPANSVVTENHGFYFFIFPDVVDEHFTGCKIWWVDSGERYAAFKVQNGAVKEATIIGTMNPDESHAGFITCSYDHEQLTSGPASECLSYDDAQTFVRRPIGSEYAPTVPPEKDIRTKNTQ